MGAITRRHIWGSHCRGHGTVVLARAGLLSRRCLRAVHACQERLQRQEQKWWANTPLTCTSTPTPTSTPTGQGAAGLYQTGQDKTGLDRIGQGRTELNGNLMTSGHVFMEACAHISVGRRQPRLRLRLRRGNHQNHRLMGESALTIAMPIYSPKYSIFCFTCRLATEGPKQVQLKPKHTKCDKKKTDSKNQKGKATRRLVDPFC